MLKTVLVTGAAKRLGRAIALDLAAHGWNIAIHYNSSEDDADSASQAVRAFGAEAATLKCDLSKEAETAALVDRAVKELGPLTALINSASLFENDDWQNASRKTWDDHIETNLRAPLLLSQLFAKQLPDGAKGNIINIIDQRVLKPTPQFLSYSVSKAGLYWLTTTLAQGMGPRIRVNAVGPGPTLKNPRQSDADFNRQRDATILGRGADPADICAAVRYLLDAEAVTGQMLAVDGGQHLIWQTPDVQGGRMSKIEIPRIASATRGTRHVFIRNLELPAHIGVYRQEEGRTQPVRINVDLATDDFADAQDMLENVVDYHVIEKRIRAIIAEGHVRLAETLAERIAAACFEDQRVRTVRVRVEKLAALTHAESVGIEIERTR